MNDYSYDDAEPCGENMCRCHHVPQHGPCGCDCPRWYDADDDTDDE